jgi:LacI family transcriptional regulator
LERLTIKDVADAAGVSTMTISRVLNNHPDVSAKTRQRIQKIIDEMGYAPNLMASSLRQGRTNTLGVAASGIEYFGPSRTIVGIEQQAEALGYSLLLNLLHHPESNSGEEILDSMLARQVDGIIWAVPQIGDNRDWLRRRTQDLATPVVFLSTEPVQGWVTALVDNHTGGHLATTHLLEQGNLQIGIITGPMTWWEARQRALGWSDALRQAGIEPTDALWSEGDWTAISGEAGIRRLLEQCPTLDAVFASNDQMALGALQALRRAGRRIPEDIAIVGFDDIPEAAYFFPPLTTVRQNMAEVGQQAIILLDRVLQARRREESVDAAAFRGRPELIIRESSMRTPAGA